MPIVPIDLIRTGERLRDVSEVQVSSLADSIAEVGVLAPVTLYRRRVMREQALVDGYGLIAGQHRIEACRKLGLTEIPAHIVDMPELQRQLAECDENLCGATLSKAERALFTDRRKQVYLALYPETGHGGDRKSSRKVCNLNEEPGNVVRFTKETAERTGRSERAVQLDTDRGGKIDEKVLTRIRGTHLDKGAYLDKLKQLSPAMQKRKVDDDLARARRKRQREAASEKIDVQFARVLKAWKAAELPARARFRKYLADDDQKNSALA